MSGYRHRGRSDFWAVQIVKLTIAVFLTPLIYLLGTFLDAWSTPAFGWTVSAIAAVVLVYLGKFIWDAVFDV
jgi:uncharacterized membrane protein YhaH (DUF805 family)